MKKTVSRVLYMRRFFMIEIESDNKLGLKVFINGIPKLKDIPPEKAESLFSVLELEISKFYNEKNLVADKSQK